MIYPDLGFGVVPSCGTLKNQIRRWLGTFMIFVVLLCQCAYFRRVLIIVAYRAQSWKRAENRKVYYFSIPIVYIKPLSTMKASQ